MRRDPWREYVLARKIQLQVGELLGRFGLTWERATRSRGPANICAWGLRVQLLLSVRSSRRKRLEFTAVKREELRDLIAAAQRIDARPVVALVWQDHVRFYAAVDGKELAEAQLGPLQKRYRDDAPNEQRWWWVSRRHARWLWRHEQLQAELTAEYLND